MVRNPLYLILALVLAFVLFVVYFVVNDLALYRSAAAISNRLPFLWKVFANQIEMVWRISGPPNVLAIGAVAGLAGVNISLTVLRVRMTGVFIGKHSLPGFLGLLGGTFAASCSACSTALVALVLGSGGLALLPFKGLEISLAALVLLAVSLYYLSESLAGLGIARP